jgi:N-acetylated-alpha-linked acidic dipeptidase
MAAHAGPEISGEQRALEERFDAALQRSNLGEWMERLAARPHHVGSAQGRSNALFMAELFESWGYETRVEEFRVLFPTPKRRALTLLAPERFEARLEEPVLDAAASAGKLPGYNAYSPDGDVTGPLVYVNYGIPEDYEELARRGIDVAGRIVIARYGASWRGIKPKVAAEHGALGCILYSDPRDDGYFQGEVYPEGGYRPDVGVQRGSVADMPLYPGDPLTPFEGAVEGAARLQREDAPTLARIPVLPISHADALPLLQALGGPVAPEAWRGGLPLTYRIGPGPAEVRLQLEFDWSLAPAYDVIARLEGHEEPEQWVIRGNHHDAWVNGATDPVSGMVALMEEARAIATLTRDGWRPRRTLVYAAWDAEEPGLLGSTEWAETHAEELRAKAVVYVNSDSNSRGYLSAGGSHALEPLVWDAAREVQDPRLGVDVAARARGALAVFGAGSDRERALAGRTLPIAPLGSGSDYTPFLQHLGIASLNLGFGGEGDYGQYHSAYDTVDHHVRFMDPGHEYGVALARVAGRVVLRISEAELLPFRLEPLAEVIAGYAEEVDDLGKRMRAERELERRLRETGHRAAVVGPGEPGLLAPLPEPVPHLNLAPLQNAVEALIAAAAAFDAAAGGAGDLPRDARDDVNGFLMRLERSLGDEGGLPGRPWFRHHVYAPGFYTGYGVKTLPGVREAIEQRRWEEAESEVLKLSGLLSRLAGEAEQAAARLSDRD